MGADSALPLTFPAPSRIQSRRRPRIVVGEQLAASLRDAQRRTGDPDEGVLVCSHTPPLFGAVPASVIRSTLTTRSSSTTGRSRANMTSERLAGLLGIEDRFCHGGSQLQLTSSSMSTQQGELVQTSASATRVTPSRSSRMTSKQL